jgi:uncharacterized membrane protein
MRSGSAPRLQRASSGRRNTSSGRRSSSSRGSFVNAVAIGLRWDPYPFILLNLAFSTQAAYAAPLILLAQTRQAERDKLAVERDEKHRDLVANMNVQRQQEAEKLAEELKQLLEANTQITREDKELTQRVEALTREIHARLVDSR